MGITKAFKFVREGERGIKLQFGRAVRNADGSPRIIEPGFVLLIPFVQTLQRHHIRQQSRRCADQHVTLKDGLIYRIGGMVIFKVVDIYKALFEIDNIDDSIDELCMAAIRDELQPIGHEELSDLETISRRLKARVETRAREWGVEILQFSLPECAPTPETANLINAALGVELRLRALEAGFRKRNISWDSVPANLVAVLVGTPMVATASSGRLTGDEVIRVTENPESEKGAGIMGD